MIRLYTHILRFVKDQVKGWVRNMMAFLGVQRRVPLWETRRSFISQFVTQEYEGRDSDITIYPWIGHLSLTQAFLYLLYNPTEEDFRIWTKEAERETWKHIPEIKSHIAEEITLDQCVQRLRKKLVQESWEAKLERGRVRERMMNPPTNNNNNNYNYFNKVSSSTTSFSTTLRKGGGNGSGGDVSSTDPTGDKLGKGQPSFFTSPSLVNLGVIFRRHMSNMDPITTDLKTMSFSRNISE